ncbi:MAG: malonyl-ACP O-methyltransferase BioC [Rhodanobacteraceae bacterium]
MTGELDLAQVRRAFARAAADYDAHAALQMEVGRRLRERLECATREPERVLDVGAGTGHGAAALRAHWPRAKVIALDLSLPMLRVAKRRAGWWKPFMRVAGDALALPLPDRGIDVLHSNLCIQWCDGSALPFAEFARVLKPGGLMLLSTFGPDTLRELRAAWAAADDAHPHVGRFLDMHDIGDAMLAAGLRDPVLDVEHLTVTYPDVHALMRELKGIGATNAASDRARGLTGKARFARMREAYEAMRVDGRIPSTWEIVYAHAFGPPEGQPRRSGVDGEVATFSAERLRGSRRKR